MQILHTILQAKYINSTRFDMESSTYRGCIYDFGSEGRGFVERGGTMERGLNIAFSVNYSFGGILGR